MRVPTEMPRRGSTRGRMALLAAGAVLFLALVSIRGLAGFYTDYLWFEEVSLTSVWTGVLGAKVGLAAIFTIAFFGFMLANLAVADRIAPAIRPAGPEEQFVERYHELVGTRTGMVRIAVAGVFALLGGPGVATNWQSWVLFKNSVPFGAKDAQFGQDIGFYVFRLPFLTFLMDWLFFTVMIVLAVTAVAHYLNGGIRLQSAVQKVTPQVKGHLSVLLALLAVIKAASYYLERFDLLLTTRGFVQGGFTDINARLPALNLLVVISLFACGLLIFNIARRGWVLPALAVGLWALLSVVVGAAIPAGLQKFRVEPTESNRERAFIQRHIDATKAAYGLDVEEVDFAADENLTASSLADNEATIRNARLWDPAIVQQTYKKLQEVRSFYQFNDVDVDRYEIDGRPTQALISARELYSAGVPSSSWVNNHLVYTHGYGAVATPSSGVTADGNPAFRLQDLPPKGRPALDKQGSIYFGQGMEGYAIVDPKLKEIDYPEADGKNRTATYSGTGGVEINSVVRRAALALRFGDINPFISSFVTKDSKAIYIRDIDERVRKAAPFLRYDADPYPVIVDGAISWIYDAYTVTNRYPYAKVADTNRLPTTSGLQTQFNYVRNSVKVVINAYSGEMNFYVVDSEDPIVQAYQKAFPALFTPGEEAPAEIQAHYRYPEDLFRVQTSMYGAFHIPKADDFYNRTDAWDVAQKPGAPASGASATAVALAPNVVGAPTGGREERMDPYYLMMRLPDEEKEDFLLLQPFVPSSNDDTRKNLTSFMVAKSDRTLKAYVMPRSAQVDGPALVNAKINQNTKVSQEITLLGQRDSGSRVKLGNLLLIPVEQSLLYIQPLYVEAEASPLPQLKRVIVVYGNKVEMWPSLRESLTAMFGSSPPTLEEQAPGQVQTPTTTSPTTPGSPAPPASPTAPESSADLIAQASIYFDNAQEALRRGDLAAYQRETDAARDLIRRVQSMSGAAPPTTTTTIMRATA